jgi:hypothetical protein
MYPPNMNETRAIVVYALYIVITILVVMYLYRMK